MMLRRCRGLVPAAALAVLAACHAAVAPVDKPSVRVTVLEAQPVTVVHGRALAVRARLENTGAVPFTFGRGIVLYFLDPRLGWQNVTLEACDAAGCPAFLPLTPSQTYEESREFLGQGTYPYVWPVGGLAGTYRVAFLFKIGKEEFASRAFSDPFVVVDTAGR